MSAAPARSELVVLVIVAVNGDAAVVGNGSWHGGHPRDDARGRVVAQDGVGGLAVLPSAAQDEDLAVADRHAAALLQPEGGFISGGCRLLPHRRHLPCLLLPVC